MITGTVVGGLFLGPMHDRRHRKEQQWIRLSEPALRSVLRPLGISDLQIDPILVRPRITPSPFRATAQIRRVAGAIGGGRVDAVAAVRG